VGFYSLALKEVVMSQRKQIYSAIQIIRAFRAIDSEMPAQMVHCLMEVALNPGMGMRALEQATGLSQSSASRNIQTLGKWHREKRPGYDLVETVEDPEDTRRKIMFLTPKGRQLMSDVMSAMGDGEPVKYEAPTAQEHLNKTYDTWRVRR
jgi:DNA-binding MarR family transcriptional regulator